jgi:hypothetical protein
LIIDIGKIIFFSFELDGQMSFDQNQIRYHILDYYKQLLGTEDERLVSLNPKLWEPNKKLSDEMSGNLEREFTMEEIKKIIFESNENKFLGPDGLSFHFYQTYWEVIKDEIFTVVNAFYNHSLDLSKLNLTTIILIPKKTECTNIKNID